VFETRENNVATGLLDPETGDPVLLPDGTHASIAIDGVRTRGLGPRSCTRAACLC
jgi:hypothetical protein